VIVLGGLKVWFGIETLFTITKSGVGWKILSASRCD